MFSSTYDASEPKINIMRILHSRAETLVNAFSRLIKRKQNLNLEWPGAKGEMSEMKSSEAMEKLERFRCLVSVAIEKINFLLRFSLERRRVEDEMKKIWSET